ncbi:MAG: ATP-binding protein [Bacteroidales bacterium]|nr:ATP-binding protein [Bacteroidales bacterium]MDD4672078.1 ATP-binding protein [Bacteroidales bacterium]
MIRDKMNDLVAWKNREGRKPLVVRGARQVGKTWLMKEFGHRYFEKVLYVNFEKTKRLQTLFEMDFDIKRVQIALQAETGVQITPENTLIIFDEIQSAPSALNALKYFCEDAPELYIIAAGSLLGVALHAQTSFPVGKVEFMDLYPMSYYEFLNALGEKDILEILQSSDWKLITTFKSRYIELLRQYYFVGGMPEAVSVFTRDYDFRAVRYVQKNILDAYEQDFSKHAPVELIPRIRMVWNSIPSQLAKENRKFIYGVLKSGARAKEFELAIEWLVNCGQVHKVFRTTKPNIPLKAYEDRSAFKLYLVDIGLLAAMGDIDVKTLLNGNSIFNEFKGAITEQYVLQQLVNDSNNAIFYWTAERSTAELDFLVQNSGNIAPLEVKAEENLQAKSLKVFYGKYSPKISIRTSMSDYRQQEWLINLPLYAINELTQVIDL